MNKDVRIRVQKREENGAAESGEDGRGERAPESHPLCAPWTGTSSGVFFWGGAGGMHHASSKDTCNVAVLSAKLSTSP